MNMTSCELCARRCRVNRSAGVLGACKASNTMRIGRADLHFWEEPPLANSGAVFFSHCSLQCAYCQNWKISEVACGRDIEEDELVKIFFELKEKGAENINLVTATHYAQTVRDSVMIAKAKGLDLPIVWNTSSIETPETIEFLSDAVDVWLADFKYYDNELGKDLSNIANYRDVATEAISRMVNVSTAKEDDFEGIPKVIVRHLVLSGQVSNSKRAIEHLWKTFGDSIVLSIMSQYTPIIEQRSDDRSQSVLGKYPDLARKLDFSEYEEVLDFADSLGIEDYFWQDGTSASESFIPDFDLK